MEKLIGAIGTVTLDSEEAISCRGAYDALTEEQKARWATTRPCWTPRPSWLTCRLSTLWRS
ncbi:MAG: hypothetical protein ACLUIX_10460 [Oscillospiraceae bacterium]